MSTVDFDRTLALSFSKGFTLCQFKHSSNPKLCKSRSSEIVLQTASVQSLFRCGSNQNRCKSHSFQTVHKAAAGSCQTLCKYLGACFISCKRGSCVIRSAYFHLHFQQMQARLSRFMRARWRFALVNSDASAINEDSILKQYLWQKPRKRKRSANGFGAIAIQARLKPNSL